MAATAASPRWLWPAAGALAASAAVVLFVFPPLEVDFYPRCVLYVLTGIYCPGCGALRAGHELLHGHVLAALGYNPLFVAALPFLAYGIARRAADALRWRPLPVIPLSGRMARALLWTILAFTVLRNIPVSPFDVLAP